MQVHSLKQHKPIFNYPTTPTYLSKHWNISSEKILIGVKKKWDLSSTELNSSELVLIKRSCFDWDFLSPLMLNINFFAMLFWLSSTYRPFAIVRTSRCNAFVARFILDQAQRFLTFWRSLGSCLTLSPKRITGGKCFSTFVQCSFLLNVNPEDAMPQQLRVEEASNIALLYLKKEAKHWVNRLLFRAVYTN